MKTKDFHDQASALAALSYTITLRRDSEGDVIASIKELDGCVAHGQDEMEAIAAIESMKLLWIESCLQDGGVVPLPEPEDDDLPSGKWVQRVPRYLHKKLADVAKTEGVSLNTLVTTYLAEAVSVKVFETQQKALPGMLSSIHGYNPHTEIPPAGLRIVSSFNVSKPRHHLGYSSLATPSTEAFIQYLSAQTGSQSSKDQEIHSRAPQEAETNRQYAYQA